MLYVDGRFRHSGIDVCYLLIFIGPLITWVIYGIVIGLIKYLIMQRIFNYASV
ncbi:22216_t:CDS:1, partial [Gigaspora margarita]